ncbi:hypothetical protein IC229_23215 [Spirosoma sp. BT702]|uniref:Lipoprotein n=1 Tax=Spirosoma profusum TaxID=2771354 RepID=A0A927ASA7_9BACT|nr:DUF6786 family protein [Spirosoma profusum]MBD2703573.1 hypothetical protein [Spirosoma profusum]
MRTTLWLLSFCLIGACTTSSKTENTSMETPEKGTFGYDLDFLQKRDHDVAVLSSDDSTSQVIVSAKYQGKVFTSTADGMSGRSFGWVHYKAFDGQPDAHMNAYGGENRLWLGPEGAQYSLFFKPGAKMEFEQWHTPPAFDTEPWHVTSKTAQSVVMDKDMILTNYAGTTLQLKIDRSVTLLSREEAASRLNTSLANNVKLVGYQTDNSITNSGSTAWTPKTGAPCLWMLDMFVPSPGVTIVIPYEEQATGNVATTDYFGQIPPDRVTYKNGVLYFKADGKSRGKLGIPPKRAKPIAGSYDADNNVLTLTLFDVDKNATYLNQEWKLVPDPLKGDVVNAYNDGPLADGSQMGPFYEIESVSPAAFLKPAEKLTHKHAVFHFTGEKSQLDAIAQKTLGVSLDTIQKALK